MGIGNKPKNPNSSGVQSCPKLMLKILEIYWLDSYKVAKQGITLDPTENSVKPYWKSGEQNEDTISDDGELLYKDLPKYSAVYSFVNKPKPQLKIKLKSESVKGGQFSQDYPGKQATLEMKLDNLIFTGQFTFPAADNEVEVTITLTDTDKLTTIGRHIDKAEWKVKATINGKDKTNALKDKTKLEFFSIYDQPADFYNNNEGVWVEILRFLFKKISSLKGQSDQIVSAKSIGKYCHSGHGLTYDTISGAPKYCRNYKSIFNLLGYINKKSGNVVNCYDQASAVQVLCGTLGIASKTVYMAPYGFINDTILINNSGSGLCNNPFYTNSAYSSARLVTMDRSGRNLVRDAITKLPKCTDGKPRSLFGNHAFVRLTTNSKIIDACAGPALADDSLSDYASKAINKECNEFVGYDDGAKLSAGATFYSIPGVY